MGGSRVLLIFLFLSLMMGQQPGLATGVVRGRESEVSVEGEERVSYLGRSLAEALEHLRSYDLNIIFSSRLVKSDMRVVEEPSAREPRQILDQLLAQHGLKVKEGPGGSLLVVKKSKREARIFQISGVVLAQLDQKPLADVRVYVPGTEVTARTDSDGRFQLVLPEPGNYTLIADDDGYLPIRQDVQLSFRITDLRLELPPLTTIIEELVVIPSAYPLLSRGAESAPLLSSQEINRLPRITNDLFRALSRLPGTDGGDVSAQFRVRGGEKNEVGVILDGLELYEPFHLKDLQSVFSVFDSNTIGYINFISGGYPAKYGNHMSAVIDMETMKPDDWRSEVGVNFFNGSALSSDSFHDGRGDWLISVRKGFLDLARTVDNPAALTAEADESFGFNDGRFRVGYAFNEHLSLAFNGLAVDDDIHFQEVESLFGDGRIADVENASLQYRDTYVWANVDIAVNDRLSFDTVISAGNLERERTGREERPQQHVFELVDRRSFSFQGIRQEWGLAFNDRHFLQWGAGFKRFEADYDYTHELFENSPLVTMGGEPVVTITDLETHPAGEEIHFYASHRIKLFKPLAFEFGVRYDRQTYIPGEPDQVSPRINFNWDLGANTVLKGGWGRIHQAQGIHELRVSDGESQFHDANQSRHQVLSLEHTGASGWFVKMDVYRKEWPDPRVRYENNFKPVAFFPEAEPDRGAVAPDRSLAEGVEFFIKNNPDKRLNIWLGYAYGHADDEFDGEMAPRNWDRRHSFQLGLNMKLSRRWTVNLAGDYRDGRPITPVDVAAVRDDQGVLRAVPIFGERNSLRLSDFRRVDLRTTYFKPFWRGGLTTFLEVTNVFNSKNVCCIDYEFYITPAGEAVIVEDLDYLVSFIPSLGVTWQF